MNQSLPRTFTSSLAALLAVALAGACGAKPAPSPVAPGAPARLAEEPPAAEMRSAVPDAKIGVAVGLLYSLNQDPATGEASLSLAAIPRVAGSNLTVRVKSEQGLRVKSQPMTVQKANATGVYRKQLALSLDPGVRRIRVLVTLEMPEGLAHGFYTIPLDPPGTKSQKLDSVKQR